MDPQRPEAQRLKMMLVDATTWRNDQERYVDSLREMLRRRTEDLSRATGLRSAANKRGDKLEAVRYQYHAAQAAYAKEPETDRVQQRIHDVERNLAVARLQETKENLWFRQC